MKNIINSFNSQLKFFFKLIKSRSNSSQHNYKSRYVSEDGKAILYEIKSEDIANVSTYEIIHEDGKGTVIVELNNLYKLKTELQKKAINVMEKGLLSQAENLLKKSQNINVTSHTHRINIFLVKETRITSWIIDAKLQNDDNKYNNKNAQRIVSSMLQDLINKSYNPETYEDALELTLKERWDKHIKSYTNKYYLNSQGLFFQITPKIVYCRYKTKKTNLNKIKNTLERSLNLAVNVNEGL